MFSDFINDLVSHEKSNSPYVIAMVVNRQVPTSSKPGDKAIINANGKISGWIGGGCTKGIVLKEALAAIQDGKPRLVKISPNSLTQKNENRSSTVKLYQMTCQSGGEVEVYLEPIMPKPKLIIMGKSHIAMALAKLGSAMDYAVVVYGNDLDKEAFVSAKRLEEGNKLKEGEIESNSYIVVCTQGENDEVMLKEALLANAKYVAFVSSRKKSGEIINQLKEEGIDENELERVKTPAGLDINAKLPEEVAVSILAEIIKEFRADAISDSQVGEKGNQNDSLDEAYFINPVCKIPIEKSGAKHIINYKGVDYFFCCDGCKVSFEHEPEKYAIDDNN